MALETAGVRLIVENLSGFTSGMASAERSVNEFARSGASISRNLQTTNRALADTSRGASSFGTSFAAQTRTAQSGFSGFVSSVTRGAGLVTGALLPLAAGAGIASFGQSIIQTGLDFDSSLSNVSALARATESEILSLSSAAQELGRTTAFSSSQALDAFEATSLAGLSVEQSLAAVPAILDVAAASGSQLGETANFVTNAISGFGLAASEAGRVGDVLTSAFTGSNVTLESLSSALSFAAPGARDLGVSIEETAASIGLLGNVGIGSTRAGTAVRGFFNRLAAPVDEASAALDELGINAFNSQGQFIGLANVVEDFETALAPLSDQARAEALNTIFGTVAATPFSALLGEGSDRLREFTAELENSGGTAETVAATQLDNLAGDLLILESATSALSLTLFSSLRPSLRAGVQGLTAGANAANDFVQGIQEGGLTLRGFSIALQDIAPSTSFALGGLQDISDAVFGLQNLNLNFDGAFGLDNLRVFRFEDLFAFEVGDLSGQIRGAFEEVSINLGDFVSFDFVSGESLALNIADFITFDSTNALTELSIGDAVNVTSGEAGGTININDVIVGTYDLATNITTVSISDLITGTLDLTTGQGSVTLGEDLTFEFDLGALQSQIQGQLTGLRDAILGTEGGFEAGTFVPPTAGIAQSVQGAINNALSGEFTFELPDIRTGLQTAISTALGGLSFGTPTVEGPQQPAFGVPAFESAGISGFDFSSLSSGLDTLGASLAGLDTGIAGAIGEGSALAGFVSLINVQIGGLATTLDSIDSTTVGESLTGVITSLTGIFTQLNTIDDLALGGIAGTLGDLTTSILNFATGVATSVDAEAIGEAAAQSASTFIASFGAVFAEPDIPGIANAASGLLAGIGQQFATAFEPGNFTVVGASLGQLTSTIIEQLSNTLSDPQFAADIGGGLANLITGLTQGLADVLDGLASETEGAGAELSGATTSFVANLISALASGLADADYGSVVNALVSGIGNALTSLVPGLSGGIAGGDFANQTFAAAGLPTAPQQQQFSLGDTLFGPESLLATVTGIGAVEVPVTPVIGGSGEPQVMIVGGEPLTVPVTPLIDQDFIESGAVSGGGFGGSGEPEVNVLSSATSSLSETASTATQSLNELAAAQSAVAESAPEPGFFDGVLDFFGFGASAAAPAEEARRTGLGTGAAFDEADIGGSINDQILSQLNFGDLPETISTATTEAISAAIPAEPLIDPEIVSTTLAEAVSAAIPAEPVIDADTVNETLLLAAQEAIPASEIPAFPGWAQVLDFKTPRLPNFPGWRRVLNFRVPRIPGFPGWGSFINFDIPSVPAFPGWAALTGAVDLATLIPPFPGWAALINVTANIPNISCDISCGGGGGGGSNTGTQVDRGNIPEFQSGVQSFGGGTALVSEAGDEAIKLPSGETFIAQGEQLIDLPAGTQIFNAAQTTQLMNGEVGSVGAATLATDAVSAPQSRASQLMQSPPSVTNITNNTTITRIFNLATSSLRSTESVQGDFAMMERLEALARSS